MSASHLLCHPHSPCTAVEKIEVAADWADDGELRLCYRIRGAAPQISLPAPQWPGPADGLWQHTCCEAFVADNNDAYREFNFSPSGQWANYRFINYRQRDWAFQPSAAPRIAMQARDEGFDLTASLPAALLPAISPLRLWFAAVIETKAGSKHYWALAHAPGQPDFHQRTGFILELPRP